MKSIFKKKAYLLMAALVMAVSLIFPIDASASPVILGLSTTDIKVGDSFTVSVSGADSSNLSLHYDGTMVSLTGQNGATLDGNILTVAAKSASFTFQAKKEGSAGFVASSDKYDRSSAVVTIAAGTGAASEDTQTETETTDDGTSDTDTTDAETSDDTSTVSDSTDASSVSDSTDDSAIEDDPYDTADVEKHGISSSDLSFRQLILDRRMILVIAVLLAVIIVLIIRLTTLHFALVDDYDDDDIDFDDEEKKIAEKEKEEEQNKLVEHVTEKKEKAEKKSAELDLDDIDEEKLTMPKAPKKPNEKLKLEDLNDL